MLTNHSYRAHTRGLRTTDHAEAKLIGVGTKRFFGCLAAFATVTLLVGACRATPANDPSVTSMTIQSGALGRAMPADVWVPPGVSADSVGRVLLLLHGRGADEHQWFTGGVGLQSIATSLAAQGVIDPPAIVSVFIDDSYGIDSPPSDDGYVHGDYERFLLDDVLPAVDRQFPAAAKAAGRFVGGISMGGYATLRLAFRHPELFAGVAGLSPAIFTGTIADRVFLYPDGVSRADRDPLELAAAAPIGQLRVSLGWGTSDYYWIQEASSKLVATLLGRGIAVAQHQAAGGHEIGTWQQLAPGMLGDLFGRHGDVGCSAGAIPRRPVASPGC
jgi:enterochelin esterase-like enzyme